MAWCGLTTLYRGLRYLGFTGHSLEEGVEGVEDPGAEEAEDLGIRGLMSQWWKTKKLWLKTILGLRTQLWLKTIQGWKTQKAQDQEQGTAANLCRFLAIF